MCRFQLYRKMLADKSPSSQEDLIRTLRICRRDNSLSRLKATRTTLLNLKVQLSHEQLPNLGATIQQAIEQLETTP
jgi:ribosomal protein L29